MHAFCLI